MSDGVSALLERQLPAAIDLRHRLHQIPELMYEEFDTAATLRAELDRLGIEYVAGVQGAPTATIATLGDPSKPCIALRAGRMHACGHDGHSAGLMGVAAILNSLAPNLPVCVKLLWQPAEEGGAGAE